MERGFKSLDAAEVLWYWDRGLKGQFLTESVARVSHGVEVQKWFELVKKRQHAPYDCQYDHSGIVEANSPEL